MITKQTTLKAFQKSMFMVLVIGTLLASCAPGQSPEQIQAQIQTGVAMTMQVQDQIGTSVAMTVEAQSAQSLGTATSTPTEIVSAIPTLTPILSTPTAFVATPVHTGGGGGGGGGGGSTANYSCDPDIDKRPRDNSVFNHGDKFDVKWTILNNGLLTWPAGKDLTYLSGPQMTSSTFVQLPEVKPGGTYSVLFDAVAPSTPGHYVMTWKLEGGFCWPYVAIDVK